MWISRLNRHASHFEIEGNQWEVLGWSHQEHLPSNVLHRHTYFEACLVGAHGEGTFVNGEDKHSLAPGTFFLARPGAIHQIINTVPLEMELFWVSFSVPHTARGEVGTQLQEFLRSSIVTAPEQTALQVLWRALLSQAEKPGPDSAVEVSSLRALAQSLLLQIVQIGSSATSSTTSESPAPSPINGLARLGVQYVHDNLERSLTPDEIARHLGVSRRQLTRLFSAYTGVPPAAYIERTRVDRARGLLRAGEKSVKEIASSVGYSDVHHFTRVFSRVVGVSPARYKQGDTVSQPKSSGQEIQNPGRLV